MALFFAPDIETTWELPEEEAAHCLRVLRLGVGDDLEVTDGKGKIFRVTITSTAGKRCRVEAVEVREVEKGWNGNLTIAIAPTKNMDRLEWFFEKAAEIGIDEISPLYCRYSERKNLKTDRLHRILVSAMKQSIQPTLTVLNEPAPFKEWIKNNNSQELFGEGEVK